MRRFNLFALLALAFWLSILTAAYATEYTFTILDIPGASFTEALGINNRGDIVGTYEDLKGLHGFLFDGKTLTTIDFPESFYTEVGAINDKGQIVGSFSNDDFRSHGFLYDHQQFTVIDAPFPDAGDTVLTGINNRGQIIGESLFIDAPTQESSNERGFLYEDQDFQVIPVTRPQGINNRGEIVGGQVLEEGGIVGVYYADGVLTPLVFPGASGTIPLGINNKGNIVGTYQIFEDFLIHGFVYAKGVFSVLDVPFASTTDTFPISINNKGKIVGVYFANDDTVHGFLATPTKP